MSPTHVERSFRWVFALIVTFTLIDRAWMVHTTMGHASDDIVVVWLGTTDYAQGVFHEPFFYGQDYGVMLEAWLAAPFVWAGCDVVTTIAVLFGLLAILPFLAFALHHRQRGEWWPAMLFAAMPLLLPVEHGLQVTALNGLAVLAAVPLIQRARSFTLRGALLTFVLGLAVFVNPNAALLALPLGLEHLVKHRREKGTVSGMLMGALPVILIWLATRWFFHERVITNTIFDWRLHFKPYMIPTAFARLNLHFAWTAPLAGTASSIALVLLTGAIILLLVQRRMAAMWSALSAVALIIFSFSFAKVHDGSDSIFFPLSRIFLGMPLLLAWCWGRLEIRRSLLAPLVMVVAIAALAHGIQRMAVARATYAEALLHQDGLPVRTRTVAAIRAKCALVAERAMNNQADAIYLLRGSDGFTAQFLAYGIPVFHPDAPMTWMVGHDRRDLQRAQDSDQVVEHALIVGGNGEHLAHALSFCDQRALVRAADPLMILVHTPGYRSREILRKLQ